MWVSYNWKRMWKSSYCPIPIPLVRCDLNAVAASFMLCKGWNFVFAVGSKTAYLILCAYRIFIIPVSFDGHLICFYILTVVNSIALFWPMQPRGERISRQKIFLSVSPLCITDVKITNNYTCFTRCEIALYFSFPSLMLFCWLFSFHFF